MGNLKDLEKVLGNKKTKEALSESLGGTLSLGLKELGLSLRKIFDTGSSSGSGSKKPLAKNQITKSQEKFEKKRSISRAMKKLS